MKQAFFLIASAFLASVSPVLKASPQETVTTLIFEEGFARGPYADGSKVLTKLVGNYSAPGEWTVVPKTQAVQDLVQSLDTGVKYRCLLTLESPVERPTNISVSRSFDVINLGCVKEGKEFRLQSDRDFTKDLYNSLELEPTTLEGFDGRVTVKENEIYSCARISQDSLEKNQKYPYFIRSFYACLVNRKDALTGIEHSFFNKRDRDLYLEL